jgi:hypothetical protein
MFVEKFTSAIMSSERPFIKSGTGFVRVSSFSYGVDKISITAVCEGRRIPIFSGVKPVTDLLTISVDKPVISAMKAQGIKLSYNVCDSSYSIQLNSVTFQGYVLKEYSAEVLCKMAREEAMLAATLAEVNLLLNEDLLYPKRCWFPVTVTIPSIGLIPEQGSDLSIPSEAADMVLRASHDIGTHVSDLQRAKAVALEQYARIGSAIRRIMYGLMVTGKPLSGIDGYGHENRLVVGDVEYVLTDERF